MRTISYKHLDAIGKWLAAGNADRPDLTTELIAGQVFGVRMSRQRVTGSVDARYVRDAEQVPLAARIGRAMRMLGYYRLYRRAPEGYMVGFWRPVEAKRLYNRTTSAKNGTLVYDDEGRMGVYWG